MGRERRERDRSVSRADGGDRLRVVYECVFPGGIVPLAFSGE